MTTTTTTIPAKDLKVGDIIRIEVYRALEDGTFGEIIEDRTVLTMDLHARRRRGYEDGPESVSIWHTDGSEFGSAFRHFFAGFMVEVVR